MNKQSKDWKPLLNNAEEEREEAIRQATLGKPKDGLERREARRVEHALRIKDVSYWLDH